MGAPRPRHWAHLLGLKSQQCLGKVCDVSESLRTGREVSLDCFAPILMVKVSWVDSLQTSPWAPASSDHRLLHTLHSIGLVRLESPDFSCEMNLMKLIHSLLLKTHPTILISCLLAQPKGSRCVREGLLPTVSATHPVVTFAQVGGSSLSPSPAFLSPSYSPGVQKAPLLPSRQPLPVPGLTAELLCLNVLSRALGFPGDLSMCVPWRLL